MNAQDIIEIIRESRRTDYQYEECIQDVSQMGLSEKYLDQVGNVVMVHSEGLDEYAEEATCVWYFVNHNVYLKGKLGNGSYGNGYRIYTWDLEEVTPRKITVTVYD